MPWEKFGDLAEIQLRYSETREYIIKYTMIVDDPPYDPQEIFNERPTVSYIRYRIQETVHEVKYFLSESQMSGHYPPRFTMNWRDQDENLGMELHIEGFVMKHNIFQDKVNDYDPSYVYQWVPPAECPIKFHLRHEFEKLGIYEDEYVLKLEEKNMQIFL